MFSITYQDENVTVDKKMSPSLDENVTISEKMSSYSDYNIPDETGKVVAVFDDGDNGIYMHGKNADGSSVTEYQRNAGTGGEWDIKSQVDHGSMLYGKYASPRDAGNFVAGMVAASKGPLRESLAQMGFGAYNMAGNNRFRAALIIFGVAGTCAGSPSEGLRMFEQVMNGEDLLTQRSINLGKKFQHSKTVRP